MGRQREPDKPGKKKPNRADHEVLFLRAKPQLARALAQFIAQHDIPPTRSAVLEYALRKFLEERGCYPPADPP